MSSKKSRAVTATPPAAPEDNGGFGAEEPAAQAPASNGKAPSPRKTVCPITRERFRAKAPGILQCQVGGSPVLVELKEFSTGSLGYYSQGKITLEIDGVRISSQCAISIQLVGSKELPA